MITNNMKITDVVKAYPKAIEIFNDFHIDYCCGGNDKLEEAVKKLNLDPDSFVELLNKKLANAVYDSKDGQVLEVDRLMEMGVSDLIDYIILTHHGKESFFKK
jgi:regulator of cell morphogenesis and NO signaling